MYHAHFGLEHGLFGEGIAADSAVFRAAKHDRLVAHFKLALASPSSSIVLHGPAGVGKTTLTSSALRAISTRLALAWVSGMPTNGAELLELILVELGVNILRTTRMERLQLWRQFQGEMRATDSRLFIVVERTEDLSIEVLHALDQLTAPDAVGNPGANLVLLGHAGIHEHLAAPLLDSLRQRIRFRAELEPFTEPELSDYLRHQVTAAGGQYERVFAPGSVASLHRYSQGVARLVNTLCESALDIAAVQQQKQLTPELVAKTAVTLLGLGGAVPAAQPAPAQPAPAAQAAALARPSAPPVETRASAPRPPAHEAPIFERRAQPRVAAPAASAPPDPRAAPLPAAPAATASAPPAPPPIEFEFDGGATDVADVVVADFPILTDAVEASVAKPTHAPPVKAAEPAAVKPAAPAPAKASAPPPATAAKAAPPPAAPPPAAKPAAKPASRVEPAAPAKPATAPAAPTSTPLPHVAAARAAAGVGAAKQPAAEGALRQTQTVRAIADAKSLDDLSDIDAATLFGDAELDLVSAALASAADWPDDEQPKATPTPAPAPRTNTGGTTGAKVPAPSEEGFDLFGLDDNAPLELIDDATLPPANPTRKTATR